MVDFFESSKWIIKFTWQISLILGIGIGILTLIFAICYIIYKVCIKHIPLDEAADNLIEVISTAFEKFVKVSKNIAGVALRISLPTPLVNALEYMQKK